MKTTVFRAKFIKLMCFGLGPKIINRIVIVRREDGNGEIIEKCFINEIQVPIDTVNRNAHKTLRMAGKCVSKHKYTI